MLTDERKKDLDKRSSRIVKSVLIILFLIVIVPIAAISAWYLYDQTADERMYAQAQPLIEQKKFHEAEKLFGDFLNLYPESPLAQDVKNDLPGLYLEWGKWLAEQDMYQEGCERLLVVLDQYPDSDESIEARKALIDATIQWSEMHLRHAEYQQAVDRLETARRRFPTASEIEDALAGAHLLWAQSLAKTAQYQSGVEMLQATLQKYPQSSRTAEIETELAQVSLRWGRALTTEGKYEQALSVLETGLQHATADQDLQRELIVVNKLWGESLIRQKNYTDGIARLETLSTRWPDSPEAAELRLTFPQYYFEWGQSLADQIPTGYEKALEVFTTLAQKYPDSEQAAQIPDMLYELHMQMGEYRIGQAETGTESGTDITSFLLNARADFESAKTLRPDSPDAKTWLTLLNIDIEHTHIFVITAGRMVKPKLTEPLLAIVKEGLWQTSGFGGSSESNLGYSGGAAPSKLEVDIFDVNAKWATVPEGSLLEDVYYTLTVTVPAKTPSGLYRVYVGVSLYLKLSPEFGGSYRPTDLKLIGRQNIIFYVLVPPG
jgi:TolA-binding protein